MLCKWSWNIYDEVQNYPLPLMMIQKPGLQFQSLLTSLKLQKCQNKYSLKWNIVIGDARKSRTIRCYSCSNVSPTDGCSTTKQCKSGVKSCLKVDGEFTGLKNQPYTFFSKMLLIHLLATKSDGSQELSYLCSTKSGELEETCKPMDKSKLSAGYDKATICACSGTSCNGGQNLKAAHTWTALSIVLASSTIIPTLTRG